MTTIKTITDSFKKADLTKVEDLKIISVQPVQPALKQGYAVTKLQ